MQLSPTLGVASFDCTGKPGSLLGRPNTLKGTKKPGILRAGCASLVMPGAIAWNETVVRMLFRVSLGLWDADEMVKTMPVLHELPGGSCPVDGRGLRETGGGLSNNLLAVPADVFAGVSGVLSQRCCIKDTQETLLCPPVQLGIEKSACIGISYLIRARST